MTLAHLQDLFQRYVLEGDARLLDRIFPPNGEDSAASRASRSVISRLLAQYGPRLLVAGRWIAPEVLRFAGIDHVVALTDDLRTECAWHRS